MALILGRELPPSLRAPVESLRFDIQIARIPEISGREIVFRGFGGDRKVGKMLDWPPDMPIMPPDSSSIDSIVRRNLGLLGRVPHQVSLPHLTGAAHCMSQQTQGKGL